MPAAEEVQAILRPCREAGAADAGGGGGPADAVADGAAGDAPAAEAFGVTLLPRHGLRPLRFQGRLLMSAAVAEPGLPVASAIALHEVHGGGYVAAVRHEMLAPLAPEARCYAAAAPAAEGLLGFLHAHDPLRDLPADLLLAAAGASGSEEAERLAAAALLAPRLRAAWRGLLAACFGQPAGGEDETRAQDGRDEDGALWRDASCEGETR